MADLPTIHPNDEATAREIIATAEALGWTRSAWQPYKAADALPFLMQDAREAIDWMASQMDEEREFEPDRCPECGKLDPCDCVVYPAAYGRLLP